MDPVEAPQRATIPPEREAALKTLAQPAVVRLYKGFYHGNQIADSEKSNPQPEKVDNAVATISTEERREVKGTSVDAWITSVDQYAQAILQRKNNLDVNSDQTEVTDLEDAIGFMEHAGINIHEQDSSKRVADIREQFYNKYLGTQSKTELFENSTIAYSQQILGELPYTISLEEATAIVLNNPYIDNVLNSFGTDAKQLMLANIKRKVLEQTDEGKQALDTANYKEELQEPMKHAMNKLRDKLEATTSSSQEEETVIPPSAPKPMPPSDSQPTPAAEAPASQETGDRTTQWVNYLRTEGRGILYGKFANDWSLDGSNRIIRSNGNFTMLGNINVETTPTASPTYYVDSHESYLWGNRNPLYPPEDYLLIGNTRDSMARVTYMARINDDVMTSVDPRNAGANYISFRLGIKEEDMPKFLSDLRTDPYLMEKIFQSFYPGLTKGDPGAKRVKAGTLSIVKYKDCDIDPNQRVKGLLETREKLTYPGEPVGEVDLEEKYQPVNAEQATAKATNVESPETLELAQAIYQEGSGQLLNVGGYMDRETYNRNGNAGNGDGVLFNRGTTDITGSIANPYINTVLRSLPWQQNAPDGQQQLISFVRPDNGNTIFAYQFLIKVGGRTGRATFVLNLPTNLANQLTEAIAKDPKAMDGVFNNLYSGKVGKLPNLISQEWSPSNATTRSDDELSRLPGNQIGRVRATTLAQISASFDDNGKVTFTEPNVQAYTSPLTFPVNQR